jgi:hypothetical protein
MPKKPEPITAADFTKLAKQLQRRGAPALHAVLVTKPKTEQQHAKIARLDALGRDGERPVIGFILRMMVLCTLPHSDRTAQPNEVITRTNGRFTLCLEPRSRRSVPYGIYPRLIMAFLTQEVQRTKKRKISLGRSLSGFMQELGITPSWGNKGTVKGMREQMERLFGARLWVDEATGRYKRSENANFASRYELWWDPKDANALAQDDLFESTVTLGEELFAEMLAHPIPFDKRVVREIKDSPLAVDLYWWLGLRVSYLREPLMVSWAQLAEQLGADYSNSDEFARQVKKQLAVIAVAWPGLRYETPRGRLKLYPSPPHVPKLEA